MTIHKTNMMAGMAAMLLLTVLSQTVLAGNLPARDCLQLSREQAALVTKGTGSNMAKGPDWAKTNLSDAKIQDIKRLITVKEKLLFRCDGVQIAAIRRKMASAAFGRWRKLAPPPPIRNPKFKTRTARQSSK